MSVIADPREPLMTAPKLDITPFLDQDEGQHFERKSLFKGPAEAKRPRDRRCVRDDVAKNVAAFANAEGGILILGIEDDLTISGHKLPRTRTECRLGDAAQPPDPTATPRALSSKSTIMSWLSLTSRWKMSPFRWMAMAFHSAWGTRRFNPAKVRSTRSNLRAWRPVGK